MVVSTLTWMLTDCACVCLQEMSVGYANGIRVMSMTHTGEPGFMLYIPIEVHPAHTLTCSHRMVSKLLLHRTWSSSLSSCSPQYALHVYNEVMSVGQKYGIRNAGYYALRSLRIEKFFAFWGQDLDAFTTPLECGREFRVKFDTVRRHSGCVPISHCTISVQSLNPASYFWLQNHFLIVSLNGKSLVLPRWFRWRRDSTISVFMHYINNCTNCFFEALC